jgi:hypothetical protein
VEVEVAILHAQQVVLVLQEDEKGGRYRAVRTSPTIQAGRHKISQPVLVYVALMLKTPISN